jgi:very-short-patch-repair endonuclease
VRSPDEKIAALAANQHGAFTHDQAAKLFTPSAIRHRLRSGLWLPLRPEVYALSGTPATWHRDAFAAVNTFGALAAGSHTTAGTVLGILPEAPGLHVMLPHGQHRELRDGVRVHQGFLRPNDVFVRSAIRVTKVPRTLLDLASIFTEDAFEGVLDDVIFDGLASARSLRRYLDGHSESRKRGIGMYRRLLSERLEGVPQKKMERIFMRQVASSPLPNPIRQKWAGDHKIDFAYPDLMIAIELDGQAIHSSGKAFRDDRRRQNEIVLSGWLILRFTWFDVTRDWPFVEATISRALAQQRSPFPQMSGSASL